MRQRAANQCRLAKGMFRPLAAEKKKAVAALCLIVVMAIMWIKVLTNNGPETTNAAITAEHLIVKDTSAQELNISFVELPQVPGRNDAITRDFFASNEWRSFKGEKKRNFAVIEEVNVVSKDGNEEVIRKVAEKLKLEAIVVLSNKPRAFINNKVISMGDKVLIRDGIETYECEVIEIKENIVVIECGEAEVTLKLTQTLMVDN